MIYGKESLRNWIRIYDQFVPAKFCDDCVEWFRAGPVGRFDLDWRRCEEVAQIGSSPLFPELKQQMRLALETYAAEMQCGMLVGVKRIEDPNIFRYLPLAEEKEPNRFHKHCDAWNVPSATRQVSIILYLNDVKEGGETVFEDIGDVAGKFKHPGGTWVEPRKGRLLVFPSNYMFHHEGRPPISNEKLVLVSWLHFDGEGHGYRTYPLYD